MEIKELLQLAISALRRNLARTMLTMLGIVIGIGSVITIMSLGAGSTQSIVSSISSFGTNILTVSPGQAGRGPGPQSSSYTTLSTDDANKIAKLGNVSAVSRQISKSKTITANSEAINSQITGVDAVYQTIQSLKLTAGTFFTESEVLGAAKDVVLGDEIVTELFGEDSADYVIGQTVRIDGKVFQIIGVITDSSAAIVPITTAQTVLFAQTHLDQISVNITNTDLATATTDEITNLLMNQHDITDEDALDFNVRSSQSFIDTISTVTSTITTMLSGIAAISLIVGGIGIMNIMLVTVTERTKEIGLLKALGAKNQAILSQFLIEALVLTLVGGLLGIVLGAGISFVVSNAISIPFVVKASSIALSFGVSAGIGVLFGYYPASKAAKLNPIDALRYE
jgi:putative ABC transport system permease protein